jgi:hypothetical protein
MDLIWPAIRFLLNPANTAPGTLIAIAVVLLAASGLGVLYALRRIPKPPKPRFDDLRNPDYRDDLDGPYRATRRHR